jgi:hypothetical protein
MKMEPKNFFIKIFLVLVLLQLWAAVLLAGPTTVQQAQSVVMGWLKTDPEPLGMVLGQQVKMVETFTIADIGTAYYIVYLEPSGFVIVPADDLIEPIIGFVDGQMYEPSLDNPLGALVTNDLSGRFALIRGTQGLNATGGMSSAQGKWDRLTAVGEGGGVAVMGGITTVSDARVPPLVESQWHQSTCCAAPALACYNYYTPPFGAGNPNNYPCGCVATAMAQLIRYHEHPQGGIGVNGFSITVDLINWNVNTIGGDGVGGPYRWDLMPYKPNCGTSVAERQAVGALCYDAGISVNMSYQAGGSLASLSTADSSFVSTFKYTNSIYGFPGPNNVLLDMINPNLDYAHPVLLGIYGYEGGHAIVCDGYGYNVGTLYHHFNMGWAGQSDAWYNLNNTNEMPEGYEYIEDCVYNVYTTGGDEIISGRVTDASGDPLLGALVTAQRTAGGTYQAVTNSRGIYALAHLPSNSTYNISVTKEGYSFVSQAKNNGISVDNTSVTGNMWGVDFTASSSSTYYVDTSAPGPTHDGASWPTAFLYLQDAIYVALSGDVIFVAEGIYRPDVNSTYPDGTYDRNATFQLKSGVALYGGFPSGGCSGWTGRDIGGQETILSGDLAGNDVDVNDPCDLLTDSCRVENSYHVVTGSYTDSVARLDGFTIKAGNADDVNWPNDSGAGMFNIQANCTVNKCKFVENSAEESGGAMWSTGSNLQTSNCTFFWNFAVKGGGAMELYVCEHPVVVNCSFITNKGVFAGSGGGGIYVKTSSPDVTNCLFVNNSTPYGAGICNINGSFPTITNCTFYGNVATVSCGGINNYNNAYPTITNCILWENTAPQIVDTLNSGSTVNYSDVNGWTGGGFGNIDADPCFVDPNGADGVIGTLDDDFTLLPDSPCIDVGDNSAVPGGAHSDIDIRLRVEDGDSDDREIVDMGACEFSYLYLGDLNKDFKVNLFDLAILAGHWLEGIY